jgi:hypothetical protein
VNVPNSFSNLNGLTLEPIAIGPTSAVIYLNP